MAKLKEKGFNSSKKTLIILEGVIYYISNNAFRDMLSSIATLPNGSRVIFDYADINESELSKLNQILSIMGEPWKSVFSPEEIKSLLAEYKLEVEFNAPAKSYAPAIEKSSGKKVSEFEEHLFPIHGGTYTMLLASARVSK